MRMRTIKEAAAYVRQDDPGTGLTETAIRRFVTTGVLPSVRVGQKYLIALENLEKLLAGEIPMHQQEQKIGCIRRLEVAG